MNDWKAKLKALHPCPEAYRWAVKHKTLREAWRMCEEITWMWWLLEVTDYSYLREMDDTLNEVAMWGDLDDFHETSLREACVLLDFMPDPPTLPEIMCDD